MKKLWIGAVTLTLLLSCFSLVQAVDLAPEN